MSGLGQKARSAVIWNTGFNIFRDLMQFVVMLVLVRLLDPQAYGQFSLVTSVMGVLAIFTFNNFIAHTLQVRSDAKAHFQEHFTTGIVLQVGMFLAANMVAAVLRGFPEYAPVAPLLHVTSLTFLLDWPCELRRKMIERQFDWRRLRVLHGIGLLLNAGLAVMMAMMGAGAYALLVPGLMVPLPFIYDLFVRQRWRPTWAWSWEAFRPAWAFGLTRIGSGLTSSGRQLLESGVLTAVLGFAALGVLNRSLGLAQLFCYKIAAQLIYALYPVLTRVEGGAENAQRVGGLVLRTVTWTVMPTAVCLGMLAEPVVQTVYGAKWMEVVPLLPWAMVWGGAAALVHVSYMLLLARQQTHKCLIADMLSLAGTGLCLWLVLPYGTKAYLMGLASVQAAVVLLLVAWLQRVQAVSWRGVADAALPAAMASLAAAVGATAVLRAGFDLAPESFLSAAAWGVLFLALYGSVLRFGFARQLSALIHYCPARERLGRWLWLPLHA